MTDVFNWHSATPGERRAYMAGRAGKPVHADDLLERLLALLYGVPDTAHAGPAADNVTVFDMSLPEPGVYTPQEVAKKLGVSAETVRREEKLGRIKGVRVGSRGLRFTERHIREYLEGERGD